MALRWRENGELLCAAKHPEKIRDTYIDDRLHYCLSVKLKVAIPDKNEKSNGVWHWIKDVFVVSE